MNRDRYLQLASAFPGQRALVLGDVMLDRFIYGKIDRVSPEAPVPVLLAGREVAMPGGAANVARNIAALGGKATLLGVAGTDDAGRTLSALLTEQPGIEPHLLMLPDRPTTLKTRFVANRQQIVRVDHEVHTELAGYEKPLLEIFARHLKYADVVILSDYAKGVLSDGVISEAIRLASSAGKPTIVDPKSMHLARYDGAAVITPNVGEAAAATKITGAGDLPVAAMSHAILTAAPSIMAVIITRGADGMTLRERGGEALHLPAAAREVYDVSGAGDTVVATLGLSIAAGASFAEAADLANIAAGIVVGKLGTAEVWADELATALQTERLNVIVTKNVSKNRAEQIVAGWHGQGLRIGFTNGCFDLIHPGHISLLNQARSYCDRLLVGLNTDASVRRLKGEGRPVQDENARAVVLAALAVVDLVVLFEDETPLDLIRLLRPDVLIKGADYTVDQVVGADIVTGYGGNVVLANFVKGQSTSGIISRIDVRVP